MKVRNRKNSDYAGPTYQELGQMSLHTLMHDAQLGSQSLNVFLDIAVQCLKINTILTKGVQHSFFTGEAWFPDRDTRLSPDLGCLAIDVERPGNLSEEVACHVGDCVKCSRLELFKTGMIENLGDAALKSCAAGPLRHDGAVIRHHYRFGCCFLERLRVVLLELVLVCLFG